MDPRIGKVLDHIEGNLSSKLVLKDLAAIACMSPSQLHRAFKKQTGRTPFKFIEEIKMGKAYQLLMAGTTNVYDLTIELGYEDYETFSRAFKKYYAIAPDDLKAIAQKIKDETSVGSESLIIKTFEVEEIGEIKEVLEQVIEKLKELLKEKGYSEEDLKKAKVISVMPKTAGENNTGLLVKNKFLIAEDLKIWQQLLNHTKNGDN